MICFRQFSVRKRVLFWILLLLSMVIFELWYVSGKREKVCQYLLSIQISNLMNKSVYIIIPFSANVSQLPKLRQQEAPVLQIRPRTTTTTTTACQRRPADSAACPRQPQRDGRGRDLRLAEPDPQGRAHPPPLLGLHGNSRYSGEGSHGGFIRTCKRCLLVFGMKSAILRYLSIMSSLCRKHLLNMLFFML